LVCGYADQKSTIDAELIHDVVRDRNIGGISPLWDSVPDDRSVVRDMHATRTKSQGGAE
jgi:hypothetical protein